jgi:integrase
MEDNQATKQPETVQRRPRRRTRCMFKDARGRWWLDFYTPDGKRRRKLVGKSKSEADAVLAKISLSKSHGEFVDSHTAPTFSEFMGVFCDRHWQHKKSFTKTEGLRTKLKQFFGQRKLSKLAAEDIEKYRLMRLSEKSHRDPTGPVSRITVNREVEIIRAMLSKAVRWGFIGGNPAGQVEDYDEDTSRERFLSTDEIRRLMRATKRSQSRFLRPVTYLALQTGMRKSEMLGLRWGDVNFEAEKILVRETKNGEPRHVPMSRRCRWLLKKIAAKRPLAAWVFESEKRDGSTAAALDSKTAWRRALRLARIEDFRFHDLRHTFASHFAMGGGDIYALAKILGHKNPKVTIDRYAHLSPAFVQAQSRIMDGMYKNSDTDGHFMDTVQKNRRVEDSQAVEKYGAPERSRTSDLLVRSQTLYPAELRARRHAKRRR